MKKWVFGCLGLFIIVAIGGGYAGYRFLYLPGKAYVQSFTQLSVVPELHAQIANQEPHTPPAGNTLSAETVERFVGVQQAVRARMGERIQDLKSKYESIGRKGGGTDMSFGETVSALKDLSGLYVEAKKAQVEALNTAGLSLAEYEWTRARVYEALGMHIDNTLQQVIREAAAGRVPDVKAMREEAMPIDVPPGNQELVKPYAQELTEGAALVFFSL